MNTALFPPGWMVFATPYPCTVRAGHIIRRGGRLAGGGAAF
ncbi:MAG: hypothetical protein WCK07_16315 [Betaproteobacteria bacterium]